MIPGMKDAKGMVEKMPKGQRGHKVTKMVTDLNQKVE